MRKLVVIDLMPFLYKGHFVFLRNPRITADGINTSALVGFANGILSILGDLEPTHAVLAMDPSGPTFRHEAFPAYKAQRDKMPEDLADCIPRAFELAEALHIPVIVKDGFEADDVMGTIAARAAEAGFEVYVATPDKDAAQLVAPHISLFRPSHAGDKPEIYDVEGVKAHWNLSEPRQMIDYLALAGDTADNIPGIHGVGEKTAATLLGTYGTVENILAHAGELKGKLAEKVSAGAEDAKISKFLTTIRTDVPIDVDFDSFARVPPDFEKLAAVCAKYELTRLAKRLLGEAVEAPAPVYDTIETMPHDYRLVMTEAEADELVAELMRAETIAFDTETSGTDARTVRLVGMSFATAPGKAWYVNVPHETRAPESIDDLFGFAAAQVPEAREDVRAKAFVARFAPVFADPAKTLVAQNAKYDITVLMRHGIRFGSVVHDTMLEHYVLDAAARHGMDALAREYLRYDPIPITRLIGEKERGKDQRNMAELPPEVIRDYAAEDADVTFRLDAVLRAKVREAGLLRALEESEEPLVPVLADMEREGVHIDAAALRVYGRELADEIDRRAVAIRETAGRPDLNIDSPIQLADFLWGDPAMGGLGLEPAGAKRLQSGRFSTDEKTLQKVIGEHPVVEAILEYRACAKLKSTYADKLPLCIDPIDGRVHTTFAQALTETGRLSSSDPNLQNIPVRTERGKQIRAAVIPRDANHVLVSADYSQIELRLLASLSGDETMVAAFKAGADIHRETAARVYGVAPEAVTADQRAHCKMVNFGIVYGISAFGLSQRLHIPRRDAAELIDAYFALYPKVRTFMDRAIEEARKAGYAVTALGRRRMLRDINSRNVTARQAAERDAMNTPVQGTAADLIKLAMVRVDHVLKAEKLTGRMVLQIHDELLFDVPRVEAEHVAALAKREMEGAMSFAVPLEVTTGIGENWLEAH